MAGIDSSKPQVMVVPWVRDDLCQACDTCVARTVCRTKAIVRIDRGEPPFIDAGLCYGCHLCVTACPHGAISLNGRSPTP